MPDSRVLVIFTGGNFSFTPKHYLADGEREYRLKLVEYLHALPDVGADSSDVSVEFLEVWGDSLSSSPSPSDWSILANKIASRYEDFDGFVVVHEVDTLAYTASALSLMFCNLSKPVILTGSNLPLLESRSDARLNYLHALSLAAYQASDLPCIPEVAIVFADKILRGCRSRKISANAFTAFNSPNGPVLGDIGERISVYEERLLPKPSVDAVFSVNDSLNGNVILLSLFPGLRSDYLNSILTLESVEGFLFMTYGTGNFPNDKNVERILKSTILESKKPVVNLTQCPQGGIELGLYETSIDLFDIGVISGLDMTPETAIAKLMLCLGNQVVGNISDEMQINWRGEQSHNLFQCDFSTPDKPLSEAFTATLSPDVRFDPDRLATASLYFKGMHFDAAAESDPPFFDVYMNMPSASFHELSLDYHPRRIVRQQLTAPPYERLMLNLEKKQVRNIVGDGAISLTFVPCRAASYFFQRWCLSLFSEA